MDFADPITASLILIGLGVLGLGDGFVKTYFFEVRLKTTNKVGIVIYVLLILMGLLTFLHFTHYLQDFRQSLGFS